MFKLKMGDTFKFIEDYAPEIASAIADFPHVNNLDLAGTAIRILAKAFITDDSRFSLSAIEEGILANDQRESLLKIAEINFKEHKILKH